MERRFATATVSWCLVLLAATAVGGCQAGEHSTPAPSARTAPATAAEIRTMLASIPPPADGEFSGGTFRIGTMVPGPTSGAGGLLGSSSWDAYFLLDKGERGAWGTAVKVFQNPAQAIRSAHDFATFWICGGPRKPVPDITGSDYDNVTSTVCIRPGFRDYLATVSAVDGLVTVNLTVTAQSRELALTGLAAVWNSVSKTGQEVVAQVS